MQNFTDHLVHNWHIYRQQKSSAAGNVQKLKRPNSFWPPNTLLCTVNTIFMPSRLKIVTIKKKMQNPSSSHCAWTIIAVILVHRFGPRQIRVESAMLRAYNSGTRAAPYESLVVADIGDVNVNVYDLKDTCKRIREAYRKILATGCIPLTMGEKKTDL